MGAGASAHAESAREGGQQITKYGQYAVILDNDKPIRVSRPDAVRRRAGRSDVTVYRSGAFSVEVVDDDAQSANISFNVRQQTESVQTFSDSSLGFGIALFFILSVVVIALMRQRSNSDGASGFVKWTERGGEPKN